MSGVENGVGHREDIRAAARQARADAQRVRDETASVRRRAHQFAERVARDGTRGVATSKAFETLPVPAALLDSAGSVVRVNTAWRALPQVGTTIGVGTSFAAGWAALTGERLIEAALTAAFSDRIPARVEATVGGVTPCRLLVHLGPAPVAGGEGALVVLVDVTTQYEREQRLLFDATHDALTGVGNRVALQRAVGEALDRLRRYHERFALIYLDLDAFKPLNDRYGHAAGDEVLRKVAERWRAIVRAPDLLARVGGDEFVVVAQHVAGLERVSALARRLEAALDEPFAVGRALVRVTVTAGVAAPPVEANPDDALALADQAMYREKQRAGGAPRAPTSASSASSTSCAEPDAPSAQA